MTTTLVYEHIEIGEDGVPLIEGTTMKVVEIIAVKKAYGWSPEELQLNHPYLTMGKIHAALAYYWDHEKELARDMEERLTKADEMQKEAGSSPFAARMRAKGFR